MTATGKAHTSLLGFFAFAPGLIRFRITTGQPEDRATVGTDPSAALEAGLVGNGNIPSALQDFASLPLKIAAMTRGLRWPWMTATTHKGCSSGA